MMRRRNLLIILIATIQKNKRENFSCIDNLFQEQIVLITIFNGLRTFMDIFYNMK